MSMLKEELANATRSIGGASAQVLFPESNGQYVGRTLYVTDTHLVQQVGRNAAVVHDLSKLDNKSELLKLEEAGKLDKMSLRIRYGGDRGVTEDVPFDVQRANDVKKQAQEWAEQNIGSSQSRDMFMRHVENFTHEMTRGGNQYRTPKAPLAPMQKEQTGLTLEQSG